MISPEPTAERPKSQVLIGGPLRPENEDRILKEIDFLIRPDRVLETPPVSADMAMDQATVAAPPLHLRLAYANRRWASAYPTDEIPSNITSFYKDLLWFMERTFAQATAGGQTLSGVKAFQAIQEMRS